MSPRLGGATLGRSLARVALVTAALAAPVVPTGVARAWNAGVQEYHGDVRWRTDGGPVSWSFESDFPQGAYRERVLDAFRAWNALGQPLQFSTSPLPDLPSEWETTCEAPHGVVRWEPLLIPGQGGPVSCQYPGGAWTHVAFQVWIDSTPAAQGFRWWTAHEDIPDAYDPHYFDLWSVATHEIGHATGQVQGGWDGDGRRGHFNPDDLHTCPKMSDADYMSRETLCATAVRNGRVGRNPSDHSRNLFRAAYPWPPPPPPCQSNCGGGGGGGGGQPVYAPACDTEQKLGGFVMGAPGTEVAGSAERSQFALREC